MEWNPDLYLREIRTSPLRLGTLITPVTFRLACRDSIQLIGEELAPRLAA